MVDYLKESWKGILKVIVGIVLVLVVWQIAAQELYRESKLLVNVGAFIVSAVSFYFPDEEVCCTGWRRHSSDDWRFEPAWWIELMGFIGLVSVVWILFV